MVAYSVKVIYSCTGTSVETLIMKKFESIYEIRSQLQFFDDKPFNFGYIKCGHGMNKKQVKLKVKVTWSTCMKTIEAVTITSTCR